MEPEVNNISPLSPELQPSFENTTELSSEFSNIEASSASGSVSSHKSSYVWLHFDKDKDYKVNKKAHCKYCHKTYTCSKGSTSNISNHLNKHHVSKLQLQNPSKKNESILDIFSNVKVNIYLLFVNFILNNSN